MLLVGPPMPDRSKVMTQTKRNTLVLPPGWGFGVGLKTPPSKNFIVMKVDQRNGRTLFDRPKPTVGCSANGIIIIIRRRCLYKSI